MDSSASSPNEGPAFTLVKVLRRIREARERRFLRALQQRDTWIEEARNAPTVQDWMDSLSR